MLVGTTGNGRLDPMQQSVDWRKDIIRPEALSHIALIAL